MSDDETKLASWLNNTKIAIDQLEDEKYLEVIDKVNHSFGKAVKDWKDCPADSPNKKNLYGRCEALKEIVEFINILQRSN